MLTHKLLRKLSFFEAFTDQELGALAGIQSHFQRYYPNEYLIREEARDTDLMVLIYGYVSVFKGDHSDTPITILGPGSVIGEMAFLTGNPRASSVMAREECTVFRVNADILANLNPVMQIKIKDQLIRVVVSHLETTTQSLLRQQEINRALIAFIEAQCINNAPREPLV